MKTGMTSVTDLTLHSVPTPAENTYYNQTDTMKLNSVKFTNSDSNFHAQVKPADTHLPKVTDDGGVSPGVLRVYAHLAVFEDDKCDRFIKPPTRNKNVYVTYMFTKTKINPNNVFVFLWMGSLTWHPQG